MSSPFAFSAIINKGNLVVAVNVDGVRLCLWTAVIKGHIVHPPYEERVWSPWQNDDDKENRKTWRKTCASPQGLTGVWTPDSAVRGWRLTAWAMVWPNGRFAWRCVSVCESYWVGNPQPATQPQGESCVLTPYSVRHSIHANVIAPETLTSLPPFVKVTSLILPNKLCSVRTFINLL
jgi:hypothetical protein